MLSLFDSQKIKTVSWTIELFSNDEMLILVLSSSSLLFSSTLHANSNMSKNGRIWIVDLMISKNLLNISNER